MLKFLAQIWPPNFFTSHLQVSCTVVIGPQKSSIIRNPLAKTRHDTLPHIPMVFQFRFCYYDAHDQCYVQYRNDHVRQKSYLETFSFIGPYQGDQVKQPGLKHTRTSVVFDKGHINTTLVYTNVVCVSVNSCIYGM